VFEQLTPSLRAHAAAARTHRAKLEALEVSVRVSVRARVRVKV
jgi:hypothetical protein